MVRLISAIWLTLLYTAEVWSACSSPWGRTGQFQWNSGTSKVRYCNGASWTDMAQSTGSSCSGTAAGTLNYASGDMRYCDGTNWINTKGASLGSCTGTTAGTFNYNAGLPRFCDGTNWYQMGAAAAGSSPPALAVDSSTVARVAGTPANGVNVTTASFTPPSNSLLVVAVSADTHSSSDITVAVSDSASGSWTQAVQRGYSSPGGWAGHVSIWYSEVASGTSRTVSVRRTSGIGGTNRISFMTYIVTNYYVGSPIGATAGGADGVNNITPTAYSSTEPNSRGFAVAVDWNALGTPTSTDTANAAHYASEVSVMSVFKASNTATAGTSVNFNFDAAGTSTASWNWVAAEIKGEP